MVDDLFLVFLEGPFEVGRVVVEGTAAESAWMMMVINMD
jgi:hypothetical protein